ncbi:hypothetical protein, partial [Cupriavidus taiwanensis]|uniref:hypothetical protein n=1 Tax=Cupriavidus taiwanensis TaxID=164546 RepID=UPI001C2DA2B9
GEAAHACILARGGACTRAVRPENGGVRMEAGTAIPDRLRQDPRQRCAPSAATPAATPAVTPAVTPAHDKLGVLRQSIHYRARPPEQPVFAGDAARFRAGESNR